MLVLQSAALVTILLGLGIVAAVLLVRLWAVSTCPRREIACSGAEPADQIAGRTPLVSVHVPVCDEPPGLVLATLHAIERQTYDRLEVVVVDNNSPSPATWKPIQDFCETKPSMVFVQFDELEGFKAGALNRALEYTSPDAEYLLTVDADYHLDPSAVATAVAALRADRAFCQFPQAYRNVPLHRRAMAGELRRYFDVFAQRSGAAVLPTGVMTLVRRSAVEAAGGWPAHSITEDAELGSQLAARGLAGHYEDREIGCGLLPATAASLARQRRRWAAGNAQTLRRLIVTRWRELGVRSLAQLTAWWSFWAVFVGSVLVAPFVLSTPAQRAVVVVIAALALVELGGDLIVHRPTRTMAHHLALTPVHATAWMQGLTARTMTFERTTKAERADGLAVSPPPIGLVFAVGLAVLANAAAGAPAGALVAAALGLWLVVPACLARRREVDLLRLEEPVAGEVGTMLPTRSIRTAEEQAA